MEANLTEQRRCIQFSRRYCITSNWSFSNAADNFFICLQTVWILSHSRLISCERPFQAALSSWSLLATSWKIFSEMKGAREIKILAFSKWYHRSLNYPCQTNQPHRPKADSITIFIFLLKSVGMLNLTSLPKRTWWNIYYVQLSGTYS